MKNTLNNLTSFDYHLDKKYGQKGSTTREAYEQGYEEFKNEVLQNILQGDQQLLEKLNQETN